MNDCKNTCIQGSVATAIWIDEVSPYISGPTVKPPPAAQAPANSLAYLKQAKKKGKPMSRYYDEDLDCYVETPDTDAAEQRNYFKSRLSCIRSVKFDELRKFFHLVDDVPPQTPAELVKRIQDGKFELSKETEDKQLYDPVRYITWRDPTLKKDQAGFDAAFETFNKEDTKTRDAIMAMPAAEAMAAVQALEAWTPAS